MTQRAHKQSATFQRGSASWSPRLSPLLRFFRSRRNGTCATAAILLPGFTTCQALPSSASDPTCHQLTSCIPYESCRAFLRPRGKLAACQRFAMCRQLGVLVQPALRWILQRSRQTGCKPGATSLTSNIMVDSVLSRKLSPVLSLWWAWHSPRHFGSAPATSIAISTGVCRNLES